MSEMSESIYRLKPLKLHLDSRGYLIPIREAISSEERIGNIYVTAVFRGAVKAWHYHRKQVDRLVCVKGRALVGLAFDSGSDVILEKVVLDERIPQMLIIPRGVYHGFMSLEKEAVILNVTDREYDPNDEYRKDWDAYGADFWQPDKG